MLETRSIAGTDLVVSQLCLGSNMFGTAVDQARADALLDRFAALGGTFIDTARVYGDWIADAPKGASERAIGAWLKSRGRKDIVVATKGGYPDLRSASPSPRVTPEALTKDLNESLEHLGLDAIPLYWVHNDDPTKPVEPIVDGLIAHRKAGRIGHFGLSNWAPERIAAAQAHARELGEEGPVAVQPFWCLASPNVEAARPQGYSNFFESGYRPLMEQGMTIVAYGSQSRGFFAKYDAEGEAGMREDVKAMFLNDANRKRYKLLKSISRARGVSIAVLTLSYMTSQPKTVIPIIGVSSLAQLDESVEATQFKLSPSELEELRAFG